MGSTILKAGSFIGGVFLCLGLCAGEGFAADSANYDTAWTFIYDGGVSSTGRAIPDNFRDIRILPNGDAVCVGGTADSALESEILLIRLSPSGEMVRKKRIGVRLGTRGTALEVIGKGGYLVGGDRYGAPFVVWLDSQFNVERSLWYFDSVAVKEKLEKSATINSIVETQDGRILAAAGDIFPDNDGLEMNSYAALLEFDSSGNAKPHRDWLNPAGYEVAGWSLTHAESGGYMLGGKQAVFLLDSLGRLTSKAQYTFSLPGVGSVTNNVSRVHQLRSGMVMVAGQSYEEDCWTRYQRLYYDAWWSPLSLTGGDNFRYTAGISGSDDFLFDFAQLADGRIAFIGRKGVSEYGLWAFVTDSTGKSIVWERMYNLPGLINGKPRNTLSPLSIAGTPDSGFIVIGYEGSRSGNPNAWAFKFVPKPLPVSIPSRPLPALRPSIGGKTWVFAFDAPSAGEAHLDISNLQGRKIIGYDRHLTQAGKSAIQVDASSLRPGAYIWKLRVGSESRQGIIPKAD